MDLVVNFVRIHVVSIPVLLQYIIMNRQGSWGEALL